VLADPVLTDPVLTDTVLADTVLTSLGGPVARLDLRHLR
jgi:hypothetical protein